MTLVVVAQVIKAQVFACRNPKSLILLSPTVVVVFFISASYKKASTALFAVYIVVPFFDSIQLYFLLGKIKN